MRGRGEGRGGEVGGEVGETGVEVGERVGEGQGLCCHGWSGWQKSHCSALWTLSAAWSQQGDFRRSPTLKVAICCHLRFPPVGCTGGISYCSICQSVEPLAHRL